MKIIIIIIISTISPLVLVLPTVPILTSLLPSFLLLSSSLSLLPSSPPCYLSPPFLSFFTVFLLSTTHHSFYHFYHFFFAGCGKQYQVLPYHNLFPQRRLFSFTQACLEACLLHKINHHEETKAPILRGG
ncbi:hypothetical protein L873DRAFT_482381 [Choiromyces venosus 120613-1]|uniref:Uncharacterized protein n=1 Tax=Choiromyces venosus 120613-1 TaxID=1336337 RepID=A0A3N4JXV7_9PEZI|nr:hypothetical protein L873DRAFT_482381 [Choiromyces venosus 120613-1]